MNKFKSAALALVLALAAIVGIAPAAQAMDVRPGSQGGRTAVAVYHPNGAWTGSPDAHQQRRALSLSKLYLGYWVLRYGAPHEKAQVERMIAVSSDSIAGTLDRAHPQAIDAVARQFGLANTYRNGRWGATRTSAYDVAKFVSMIKSDPVAQPIIRGMRYAAPVAQDGFRQDYGTSRLPGAEGTKYGWAGDRRSATATVSFGPGWVAAALTYGDAAANTHDALRWIGPEVGPVMSSAGPFRAPAAPLRDVLPPQIPPHIKDMVPRDIVVPTGPISVAGSSF